MTVGRRLARLRRRAAGAAWRAALGPVGGRVPRTYLRSIVAWEGSRVDDAHLASTELLEPAYATHYDFDPALPERFRRSKAFDDRYLYRLRDVCVSARTGLCWLPRGLVLAESCTGSVIRLLGWGGYALEDPLIRPSRTIEGSVVVLPEHSYSHWLFEDLPAALHALERAPEATLLVPRDGPRWLEEALELLPEAKVHRSDGPVRVEELVLAGRDQSYGCIRREDVEILRRTILPQVAPGSDEALYVSRRLDRRHPANEAELERALAARGFRVVTAQHLTFPEQVGLFAGARFIAGPHGAGLANIVWSEAAALSEVFTARLFKDYYARLAVSLGSRYRPSHCSVAPPPHGTAPVAEIAETALAL